MSPEQIQKLLRDLQLKTIELELQNEDLRAANAERDVTQARYFDFYDLAPVGYCSLNRKGLVVHANLNTAALLGLPRDQLIGKAFIRFVAREHKAVYYNFLNP